VDSATGPVSGQPTSARTLAASHEASRADGRPRLHQPSTVFPSLSMPVGLQFLFPRRPACPSYALCWCRLFCGVTQRRPGPSIRNGLARVAGPVPCWGGLKSLHRIIETGRSAFRRCPSACASADAVFPEHWPFAPSPPPLPGGGGVEHTREAELSLVTPGRCSPRPNVF